jgi:hypothetical protein
MNGGENVPGPERKIENRVIARLKSMGFDVEWLTNRRRRGWPDLTVMWQDRVLFVEVKAPDGAPSANQLKERAYQVSRGRKFIISDDEDEIIRLVCEWRDGLQS